MTETTPSGEGSTAEVSSVRLAQSIMAKKPRLGELLRLTAVPFWFDADLVAALRARDDGQAENVLALLDQFSFVHTGYGRYWYSGDMRHSLLTLWSGDPDGLATAHRRALGYFERRMVESPPDDAAAYEELAAAHLYHFLALDQQAGIKRLLELFAEASEEHRLDTARKYVRIAEEHRESLSPESQAYLDYLHGRLLQLQQRWPESRDHLQQMLEGKALPPLLQAYVRRSLADAFVPLGRAADAIPLYEQALAEFRTAGEPREIGLTMAALGNGHLNLALSVWGSGWLRRPPSRFRLQSILGLGHFLVRFPLVLYLLWRLGFRQLLPVVHRVGSGMDWIVARVLVTAGDWFRCAEEALEEAGAPAGLVDVREGQAQLYRLLDHPQRAEALNRQILEMDTVHADGYRATRARLGIAHSLLLQEKAGEAAELLDELLPVFRRFEHGRRVAQTLTLRAEAALLLHRPDEAIRFHRDALAEWQALDDLAAASESVHAMETIQAQQTLSDEDRQVVKQASQQLSERLYPVRYFHPWLVAFSQVALVGLAVLFFLTVRLAIRSESGTQVDATASLVKPIHRQIPTSEELSPDVSLTIEQQLRPSPPVQAAGLIVLGSFAGYLLLYTVAGWLVIATTPVTEIKPGEVRAVVAGPDAMRLLTPAGSDEPLAWRDVSVLLRSDRIVLRRPLQTLSFFALFGGAEPISVGARTRRYQALEHLVQRRIAEHTDHKVRVHDLGFSLLRSPSGWLFMASLIYLLAFFIVAIWQPDLVTHNVDPIPYNAVDFYWLAYLGLALPLAWWFAVQPLRAHWLVSVRTPLVWLVGAAGLALGLISLLQIFRWHLSLGRPDIVTAVLAILLVGVASRHVLRARVLSPSGNGQTHVYPFSVRAAVGLIAGVTLLAMGFAITWELISFHHLATGNSHLRAAERFKLEGQEQEAREAYLQALEAYDQSLWFRPEAYVHNSRGAVLTRLGDYAKALNAYRRAEIADPAEPTYIINQALVYESQASAASAERPNITLYELAIASLDQAIEQMEARPDRYQPQLLTARLLRGGAYYDRGQIYLNRSDQARARDEAAAADESLAAAIGDFERSFNDYDWLVAHKPDDAAGYAGRGWAVFRLRERLAADDYPHRREQLDKAMVDFRQAIDLNPDEISAKIGLGWANFYYSQSYPRCTKGEGDPEGAQEYRDRLEAAISAYDGVIDQEEAAIHYRVRAQLQWLLRFCDGFSARTQYEQSRLDYDRAIELRLQRATTQDDLSAVWYNRRGNLSYTLAGIYTDTQEVRETRQRAIDDYRTAAELEPEVLDWWEDLALVAYQWRNAGYWQDAFEGFLGIVNLGPNRLQAYAYGRLGWIAYLYQSDYVDSLQYSAKSLELNREQPAVHFNEGLAYLVQGNVQAAVQSYLNGIEAADRATQGRKTFYDNAIYDLNDIQNDPAGAAGSFVEILKTAKQRRACTIVQESVPGLVVRAYPEPFPLREPPIDILWAGNEFLPAARDPNGHWLYGVIKGQEVSGWINGSGGMLSCAFDLAPLPVADPALLIPP